MKTQTQPKTPTTRQLIVTVDDSEDITAVKRAIKMLRGVTLVRSPKAVADKRDKKLYDPETGIALNAKTMQTLEEARRGENIAFRGNVEDFIKMTDSL